MDNAMGKDIKENKQVVWCGSKPETCDVCFEPITDSFIDGKTIHGPWGNMCPRCHKKIGVGLGTGRGQLYQLQDGKFVKKG